MARTLYYVLAIACSLTLAAAAEPRHTYMLQAGYVPDAATAIKIAVAVWEPIYGAEHIAAEKPYHATLHDGVWTVTGSLPNQMLGGVAIAKIAKQDGRIIRVSHGK
jgi:hypothetical protein